MKDDPYCLKIYYDLLAEEEAKKAGIFEQVHR
jgi:hypothetical protein